MRLEKIKLAGFKSFVDPTTVPLPSNLVGIVGPNGCGKSNVIDAVRWVMGESSAKMLRGESMSDVIFNGSNSRKPVGTASIELLFDNADGSAGGQYAQYSQISVKRQVSRDGQSSYFMNGVRCRRRDITDLFLGTGLGPRSYSIIEQGMISRLIEARPEDLRAFLEEAAGISKYKERRRETENRISHTRENLDRLNDLREEVAKQLQHLQRQAATAERYKTYKEKERRVKAELLALRWRALDEELVRRSSAILEQQTDLEAAIAKQRSLEAEIEHGRQGQTEANDKFNEVQGRFYGVGSEISRLEQSIRYVKESRQQHQSDLHQTEQAWRESSDHRQQDETRLVDLNARLENEEPELESARASERELLERLAESEQAVQSWQSDWERFNREAAEPAQTAQVERTRINHLEQQEKNLWQRTERLTAELERLDDPQLAEEISRQEGEARRLHAQSEELATSLQAALEEIRTIREARRVTSDAVDAARERLQTTRGRLASLEALQQSALGKSEKSITQWLGAHGLEKAARLAERIDVDAEWQRAVETVLGFHLQAVCVDDLGDYHQAVISLERGNLALIETGGEMPDTAGGDDELISKVRAPGALRRLIEGIRVADDLEQAMVLRSGLRAGQSVVTRDGVWVGANWLRLSGGDEAAGGVLERESEIRQLNAELKSVESDLRSLEEEAEAGRERLRTAETSREARQSQLNEANKSLADIRSALSGKKTRAEHLANRRQHVQGEIEELTKQSVEDKAELERCRVRLHTALEEIEGLAARREHLVHRRDELREQLNTHREEANQQRARVHEIALRVESMRTSRDALKTNLERMAGQLSHLAERREELQQALHQGEQPLIDQQLALEQQLEQRVAVEQELKGARNRLEEIDNELRRLEQERHRAEETVQEQRGRLDQLRMQSQEVQIRSRTLDEQLEESGFHRDELFLEMPGDANVETWNEEVERMDLRIRRLGPINLAAIDEFQEQSERMKYLDAQHADVTESLETLENAIRKIDRETRTRFKETYDKVNNGLQEKFPRLFGGGHAYLQLTGEDLLDTGVTVMARPPGKRNSSIHLLSGGEKALTAVALVFAIFELNPAPFCMLDEVDAPLDDANVGRFCDLVKSMSDRVQFIFITHNKITMEIASQLTGVTMNEPGVSRLVSVDVDEAARMVAL